MSERDLKVLEFVSHRRTVVPYHREEVYDPIEKEVIDFVKEVYRLGEESDTLALHNFLDDEIVIFGEERHACVFFDERVEITIIDSKIWRVQERTPEKVLQILRNGG